MNEAQAVFISLMETGRIWREKEREGEGRGGRRETKRRKWKDCQTIALIGWHSTQNNCECAHLPVTRAQRSANETISTWKNLTLTSSHSWLCGTRCTNIYHTACDDDWLGRWWQRRRQPKTYTGYFSKAFIGHTMWPPPWHYWFVWVWLCRCATASVCVCACVLVEKKTSSSSFVVVIVDDVLGFGCPLDRSISNIQHDLVPENEGVGYGLDVYRFMQIRHFRPRYPPQPFTRKMNSFRTINCRQPLFSSNAHW